jgi:hypothetical protein
MTKTGIAIRCSKCKTYIILAVPNDFFPIELVGIKYIYSGWIFEMVGKDLKTTCQECNNKTSLPLEMIHEPATS